MWFVFVSALSTNTVNNGMHTYAYSDIAQNQA